MLWRRLFYVPPQQHDVRDLAPDGQHAEPHAGAGSVQYPRLERARSGHRPAKLTICTGTFLPIISRL